MLKERDLFEELREYAGCEYISDLRRGEFNRQAREYLKTIDCSKWQLSVLTDISEYIFSHKTEFENAEQAQKFFKDNAPLMKG